MLQTTVELVKAIAWPATTLLIAWLLRHEVRSAFARIEQARLPGGAELSFGKTKADNPTQRTQPAPEAGTLAHGLWTKAGSVYWLGHDIMWTIDVVLRSAQRETINHGLTQSVHHLREIGLGDSTYGQRLARLRERASGSLDSDWNASLREEFALELRRLSDQLGAIAEMQQPAFAAGPMYEKRDA
jgi:hypothetical protein